MNKTSKKLKRRNRLARKLLIAELGQSREYKRELTDPQTVMSREEREYKLRVLAAVEKAKTYCKNFPDGETRTKFLNMLIGGNSNMTAICDKISISTSTYSAWINDIAKKLGAWMGIWI